MTNFSGAGRDVIADLLETIAFCSPGEPLSRTAAQLLCHAHFAVSHDEVTDAFAVVKKRSERLNGCYPFGTADTYIVYEGTVDTDLYVALNLVSPQGLAREVNAWTLDSSAKLFELLAEKCLGDFFGNNTETVNFGHPSEVGRPAEFDQAVRWLGELAGIKIGAAYRPPRRKDGGVDIFVWKRFEDTYPGVPLLMVQCTIMKDYLNKIGDIDIPLWSAWLSSDINPLAAIALPIFVSNKAEWDEIATRGIMLDRGRLVAMNATNTVELPLKYRNYIARVREDVSELIK